MHQWSIHCATGKKVKDDLVENYCKTEINEGCQVTVALDGGAISFWVNGNYQGEAFSNEFCANEN